LSNPTNVRAGCTGKRTYANFKAAEFAAKQTNRTYRDARVHAYACRDCHRFHVGSQEHQEDKRRKAMERDA
jgi:hypothetical protein